MQPTTYPRKMILELTAKCNFHCPFCYCVWHEFPELAKPELDTRGWMDVLDKCAADGVADILFTGGEALLRPDILEILAYARERLPAARFMLITNASLLTEPLLLEFRRLKVKLSTSLQGLASYGRMTGTRRRYNDLLRVLARAKELGWPMSVSITVTAANRGEVYDMFAAAVLSGAASVQIEPMMIEGRGKDHPELMLPQAEWEKVKAEVRALPNTGVPCAFVDEFVCTCRTQPDDLLALWANPKPPPCRAGKSFGVAGPDGTYRICLHALPENRTQARLPGDGA